MIIPAPLLTQLARHEGYRPSPYLDSEGFVTIGCGCNLSAHPECIPYEDIRADAAHGRLAGPELLHALRERGMVWTRDQAMSNMVDHVTGTDRVLTKRCPPYRRLQEAGEEVRAAVLLNMAFNMGVRTLLTFRRTLHSIDAALTVPQDAPVQKAFAWRNVADNMRESAWARQVKSRAMDLCRQMETGEWQ